MSVTNDVFDSYLQFFHQTTRSLELRTDLHLVAKYKDLYSTSVFDDLVSERETITKTLRVMKSGF